MTFTQDDIRRIKDASEGRLVDVISDFHELRRKGKDYVCDCPVCKGKDKLSISPAKKMFKCWVCPTVKGKNALAYLMSAED
ncbi:CHC2 zinc finger domain-containing protein, partial [Bacteroides sp. ET489]|uniref:CHC2 zinc finger domain-containing protein n=1 Tax=Bacteroides sp. ET489 TaxID=3057126 RepID=UPI0026738D90